MSPMTLHIDNPETEAAVQMLAARLGTDDATIIDALVLDAKEALETAASYSERRNARVRLRMLTARIQAAAAARKAAEKSATPEAEPAT